MTSESEIVPANFSGCILTCNELGKKPRQVFIHHDSCVIEVHTEPVPRLFNFFMLNLAVTKFILLINAERIVGILTFDPPHEKTNNLHMRKQRRRSASR